MASAPGKDSAQDEQAPQQCGGADTRRFRVGTTPGSFRGMPPVVLRDMKNLTGASVDVVMARKRQTWGVIPQGASSPSAVDGEKLLVDSGLQMPVTLVDVELRSKDAGVRPVVGRADAFRAERWGWSVILPSSKPGSASVARPGDLYEKGSEDAWVAPIRSEAVTRNGIEQRGIFAARPFSPGDCIFVESPCLTIPEEGDVDDSLGGLYVNKVHKKAIQAFLALPVELKKKVLEMYCPERLLVTLSDRKSRWQTPISKETFFEQLARLGIQVGDSEDDKAVIWRFIRIWDVNCMDVASGTALLISAGRMNHSCRPNVARVLLPGNQIAIVAIREIAADEELATSYLIDEDLLKPRERRQQLLAQWDFQCECSRCSEGEDAMRSGGITPEEETEIEALSASIKGDTVDISHGRAEFSKLNVPSNHWLRPIVDAALRDLEVIEGNYREALNQQAAILKFWDEQLPAAFSIRRAQLRGVLGDHERRLNNYMAACRLYCEGLAEVSSFQYPGHTAVGELRGKLQSLLTCDKGAKCKQ